MTSNPQSHIISEADTMEFLIPLIPNEAVIPSVSSRVRIDYAAATHPGNVRKSNEDSYIVFRTGRFLERLMTNLRPDEIPERHDENAFAMGVADGIGGGPGGEIASRMAIRVCVNLIVNSPQWALKLDNPETRDKEIADAEARARNYFQKIDAALDEAGLQNPSLRGMGTTLTGAYIFARDGFIVHTGDSRAYLFRDNQLKQLTHDHTVAQALADSGDISQEQANRHFMRHTLTSCLGGKSGSLRLDIHRIEMKTDDRILLCTDGLTDEMSADEVSEILASQPDSDDACRMMLERALQKKANDNITVTLAGYSLLPHPKLQ
jgi:protein phosphatase